MSQLSDRIVRRVRARARYCCEYCQSQEHYVGEEFTIDHIIPRSRGGTDVLDNLCLACYLTNQRSQTFLLERKV
ncbi:HNH endonuclease [Candidatus Poribacteria bacterium]|nr:HNH endonuclease [Candidatus Poribacteria bacterium]